ncbi:MAG TPA: DoxX family protein [Candidatus Paceibacterota bacterium]|nr:DoxX family protein [Candidatus Paceibacterota bacterium]
MTHQEIGYHILRLGLAALFLWFGFSQLLDGVNWVSWVPEWAVNLVGLPPALIVLLNGAFEVVAGALIALNLFTRWAALLLALHLAVITFDIGLNAIGVRDFGLTMATLALVFLQPRTRPSGSSL